MRTAMKWLATHIRLGLSGHANFQQQFAVSVHFSNRMVPIVGAVNTVIGPHVTAVGPMKQTFTPGAEEIAVSVEHYHRMFTAIEHEYRVVAVDGNARYIAKLPTIRESRPVLFNPIAVIASA
jgi:hypothetical protein